jgi:hypothetical protein
MTDYYKKLFVKKTEDIFSEAATAIQVLKSKAQTPDDARQVRVFEELLTKARELELERSVLRSIAGGVRRAIHKFKNYPESENTNNRARAFLRDLGVISGKPQKRYDGEKLLFEYMALLRGTSKAEAILFDSEERPPLDKWPAIEFLTKKHGISSEVSCLQHLKVAKASYNKTHQDQIGSILPFLSDTAPPSKSR